MKFPLMHSAAIAVLALSTLSAHAADASVTNNVIMGSGIANGGFTVNNTTNGDVEIGLRARERHALVGNGPTNITGSNNDGTYNHNAGEPPGFGLAGQNRARWNFDWSINTDTSGTSGVKVSAYSYRLGMDFDPSFGTNFQTFDPINSVNPNPAAGGLALWDHSFGNNGTAQSAGVEASGGTLALALTDYNALKASNNLVQNSWNYDFFDSVFSFDPNTNGNYNIFLEAINSNGAVISRSDIEVIVGTGFVPEPGSMALVGAALAGLALSRRRKQ